MNLELEKMLVAHNTWLKDRSRGSQLNLFDVDVIGADLSGRDLSEAVINRVNFINCNFSNVVMNNARWNRTVIQESNFFRADMTGSWLRYCSIHSNHFNEAVMREVILNYSDIIDNDFSIADLSHSEWFQTSRSANVMHRVITTDISNYNLFSCTGVTNNRASGIVCDLHTNKVWHQGNVYDFKEFIYLLKEHKLNLGAYELEILKGITGALLMYSNYNKDKKESKLWATG